MPAHHNDHASSTTSVSSTQGPALAISSSISFSYSQPGLSQDMFTTMKTSCAVSNCTISCFMISSVFSSVSPGFTAHVSLNHLQCVTSVQNVAFLDLQNLNETPSNIPLCLLLYSSTDHMLDQQSQFLHTI